MKNAFTYRTPIGVLTISEEDGTVTGIYAGDRITDGYTSNESTTIKEAHHQLAEYLDGKRKTFDIPIKADGTDFEQKVWEALRGIPYGETRSYADIARSIGNPKACRAVGRANGRNPHLIVTPCHRVIGANGSLTGFAAGTEMKKRLLEIENITITDR